MLLRQLCVYIACSQRGVVLRCGMVDLHEMWSWCCCMVCFQCVPHGVCTVCVCMVCLYGVLTRCVYRVCCNVWLHRVFASRVFNVCLHDEVTWCVVIVDAHAVFTLRVFTLRV